MTNQDYETRVRALEAQGATRSDAQAVVDVEILREPKPLSIKQRMAIKAHWPGLYLSFLDDGTVMAKKARNGAKGILYTPKQTAEHLAAIGMQP